jgi:hypothetical protein
MALDISQSAASPADQVIRVETRPEQSVAASGTTVWAVRVWMPQVVIERNRHEPTEVHRLRFQRLADIWREQTRALSSDSDIVANFAYHQIIGMGERALPLIFNEMQAHGGRWFWALRAITGENPVRPEDRGNVRRMTETWLEWARQHDYVR